MSMIQSAARTRTFAALAFLAACAATACGGDPSGSGPGPGGSVVSVGQAVSGDIHIAGQVDTFRIRADSTLEGGLYLRATSGAVHATLIDAAGRTVASVSATVAQPEQGTDPFTLQAGAIYRALVSAAAFSTGGGYRVRVGAVGGAPEQAPAQLTPGDTVAGERLESATDTDDFTFTGSVGESYIVFAQALGPATGGLKVRAIDPGRLGPAGTAASRGGDAELERQSSGVFLLTGSGTVHVIVAAADSGEAYRGEYRLLVQRVDFGPESRPAALVPGDTMTGEAIDFVGDVDRFTLSGTPGQAFNLFIQGEPGSVRGVLQLEVSEPGGANRRTVTSDGTRPLLAAPTGTMLVPSTGALDVRVSGASDREVHRGRYRLFAYPVDRRPEHVSATLALGDSVTGEGIDLPGDVDEFTITVAQPTLVGMTLALPARQDREAVFALIDGALAASGVTGSPAPEVGGGRIALLGAGEHTLRVSSSTLGVGLVGPYRVHPYAIDSRPEHAAAALAIGDTVTGEDLRPSGDRDEFTFQATAGQVLNLFVQADAAGAGDQLYAEIESPIGEGAGYLFAPFDGAALGDRGTRFLARQTGTYRVRLYGTGLGTRLSEQASYRLALLPCPRGPEHLAASVALGDSVAGEKLDLPGDEDVFVVSGTPGATAQVALRYSGAATNITLHVTNPAGTPLAFVSTGIYSQQPGFIIPAGGSVVVSVREDCGPAGCVERGAYSFTVK